MLIHGQSCTAGIEAHATSELLQLTRSAIGGHDDHRIAEINQSSVTIRQPSFIQHLEQHVEHVPMCFLDLVEQDDGVGMTTNTLCELTAFLIAYISRRRTYES